MGKLSVRVTKGFPLWYEVAQEYLTTSALEVEPSAWLQAQIDAGLVEVVGADGNEESSKPKTTRKKVGN